MGRENFGKLRLSILKKPDVKRFYNSLADELNLKDFNIHTVLHQVPDMVVDDHYIRTIPSDNVLKELKAVSCFQY